MSKVCIVFDRIRTEEKMLQSAAIDLGCDVHMLDAKTTKMSTNSKDISLGDIAIERCISYFRGLHFTAILEFIDMPVLNRFDVASICGDKMFMTLRLKKHNIPTPVTNFAFSSSGAIGIMESIGYPAVIKPVIGSWGRGVMPVKDRDTMDAIIEIRDVTDGPYDRIYYLQEMIDRPPRDIRVITVGNQAIAAMYRRSTGDFKTNVALGADPEICKITKEMEEIAIKAADAVGGGILGIDMMEDKERGLVVHEVNNTVEFKGIAKVAERDIPKEMITFALDYIKR